MHESRNDRPPAARAAVGPLDEDPFSLPPGGPDDTTRPGDWKAFLRGFLKNPTGVASMVPSSRWLERRVVTEAKVGSARCVVELGPGTGGTTRALLAQMEEPARLLAIELEPRFHAHLSRSFRDRRLALELGSAERLEEFLVSRRLPAPEAIVSGIPFSTMPADVGDRIASAIGRVLAPGGRFVAYQWTPVVAHRTSPYLGEPRRQWEPLNIPPMRVFTWVKPAA
jgi:phospholipid N-methyltransferase